LEKAVTGIMFTAILVRLNFQAFVPLTKACLNLLQRCACCSNQINDISQPD
jgi:hypothetical protein